MSFPHTESILPVQDIDTGIRFQILLRIGDRNGHPDHVVQQAAQRALSQAGKDLEHEPLQFSSNKQERQKSKLRRRKQSESLMPAAKSEKAERMRSKSFPAEDSRLDHRTFTFLQDAFTSLGTHPYLKIEGIYRESPDGDVLKEAIKQFKKGKDLRHILVGLKSKLRDDHDHAILLSSLIKRLIREHCEGVIPYSLSACCLPPSKTDLEVPVIIAKMRRIYDQLGVKRQNLLLEFLEHLVHVVHASNENKMTPENLSKVLAPVFFEMPVNQESVDQHLAMLENIRQTSSILLVCILKTMDQGIIWLQIPSKEAVEPDGI